MEGQVAYYCLRYYMRTLGYNVILVMGASSNSQIFKKIICFT